MTTMSVQEALELAKEAEKEGYVNRYPKALVVLSRYVALLELANETMQADLESNGKRLQTNGSSESDLPTEQGPEH
jgi:hypothetical protein